MEDKIFDVKYWGKTLLRALLFTCVTAIVVVTFGVLAIPVVMAVVYSWLWLFLYVGYLAIGTIAYLLSELNSGKER